MTRIFLLTLALLTTCAQATLARAQDDSAPSPFGLGYYDATGGVRAALELLGGVGLGSYSDSGGQTPNAYDSGVLEGLGLGGRLGLAYSGWELYFSVLGQFQGTAPRLFANGYSGMPGFVSAGGGAAYEFRQPAIRLFAELDELGQMTWSQTDASGAGHRFSCSGFGVQLGVGYAVRDFLRLEAVLWIQDLTVSFDPAAQLTDGSVTALLPMVNLVVPFHLTVAP